MSADLRSKEASSATGTVDDDDDDDGGGGGAVAVAVEAVAPEPLNGDAMILIVNGSWCSSLCLYASYTYQSQRLSFMFMVVSALVW